MISYTSTSGLYSLNVSSLNIDIVVNSSIFTFNSKGNCCLGTYWNAENDYFDYYLTTSKQSIVLRSGADWAYGSGWLILYYTKTTD